MMIAAAFYLLSPVDLLPDWMIPFAGLVDDAIVVPTLFWLALRLAPRDVVAECRSSADHER